MPRKLAYRFVVLGRYPARLKGNESAVTVNLSTGPEGHLTYSGTLTMTEAEWETLIGALRDSLGAAVEVDDHTVVPADWK